MIIISFILINFLHLNNIKIQNDILTEEMIMGEGIKNLSTIGGIISSGLFIFSYMYPDKISRNAGSVAMGASTMLSRVNTLVNVGYAEELDNDLRSSLVNHEQSSLKNHEQSSLDNHEQSSFINLRNAIQEEYIKDEVGTLNRKGGKFLTRLYGNDEEFREEIINFVRDKKELDLELILDKRCKTNTLNTLGNKYLAECITSKDNTKDLIEIMVKYYPAKRFH